MKTIEQLIKEIDNSETLQNELKEIKDKEALEAFFKKNDCGATAEEYIDYVKSRYEGELFDEDTENAVGGWGEPAFPHWRYPDKFR